MSVFVLDPRLEKTGVCIAHLQLCQVIIKQDARWPWVILVPARIDLREWHDLESADRALLSEEIALASKAIAAEPGVEKVNVAALGNQVAQLHVHIVGRWQGDPAWPGAVFGAPGKTDYPPDVLAQRSERLRMALGVGPT